MVEIGTVSELSKVSIRISAAFAVIGVGLLYLYIAVTDASNPVKILWSAALSLGVAIIFLVTWTMARDALRTYEREAKRKKQ
jgi:peptidoglycan/LPS O-acetylase OafA/YrhL